MLPSRHCFVRATFWIIVLIIFLDIPYMNNAYPVQRRDRERRSSDDADTQIPLDAAFRQTSRKKKQRLLNENEAAKKAAEQRVAESSRHGVSTLAGNRVRYVLCFAPDCSDGNRRKFLRKVNRMGSVKIHGSFAIGSTQKGCFLVGDEFLILTLRDEPCVKTITEEITVFSADLTTAQRQEIELNQRRQRIPLPTQPTQQQPATQQPTQQPPATQQPTQQQPATQQPTQQQPATQQPTQQEPATQQQPSRKFSQQQYTRKIQPSQYQLRIKPPKPPQTTSQSVPTRHLKQSIKISECNQHGKPTKSKFHEPIAQRQPSQQAEPTLENQPNFETQTSQRMQPILQTQRTEPLHAKQSYGPSWQPALEDDSRVNDRARSRRELHPEDAIHDIRKVPYERESCSGDRVDCEAGIGLSAPLLPPQTFQPPDEHPVDTISLNKIHPVPGAAEQDWGPSTRVEGGPSDLVEDAPPGPENQATVPEHTRVKRQYYNPYYSSPYYRRYYEPKPQPQPQPKPQPKSQPQPKPQPTPPQRQYYGGQPSFNRHLGQSPYAAYRRSPYNSKFGSSSGQYPSSASNKPPPPAQKPKYSVPSFARLFRGSYFKGTYEGSTGAKDPCSGSPCLHDGTCTKLGSTGYSCACPVGFTGRTCETASPCDTQPCSNGGTCSQTASGFTCACPEEYTGPTCESVVTQPSQSPCESGPCQNGGTCTVSASGTSFTCTCTASFTGRACDTARTNPPPRPKFGGFFFATGNIFRRLFSGAGVGSGSGKTASTATTTTTTSTTTTTTTTTTATTATPDPSPTETITKILSTSVITTPSLTSIPTLTTSTNIDPTSIMNPTTVPFDANTPATSDATSVVTIAPSPTATTSFVTITPSPTATTSFVTMTPSPTATTSFVTMTPSPTATTSFVTMTPSPTATTSFVTMTPSPTATTSFVTITPFPTTTTSFVTITPSSTIVTSDPSTSTLTLTTPGTTIKTYPSTPTEATKIHSTASATIVSRTVAPTPEDSVFGAGACISQAVKGHHENWGLDMVDMGSSGSLLNHAYTHLEHGGHGIWVYVIDSGISLHDELPGPVEFGVDFSADDQAEAVDTRGHGTHVACTVASRRWGVAKGAGVVGVKILDRHGAGSVESTVRGMEYAVRHIKQRSRTGRAVLNLSIGTSSNSDAIVSAVDAARAEGIPSVVAAGNSDIDACNTSPANAKSAVTVGCVDSDATLCAKNIQRDADGDWTVAWGSNFGRCVDVLAPGMEIISCGLDNSVNKLSGTSMAAPHVAGMMATYLQVYQGDVGRAERALRANCRRGQAKDWYPDDEDLAAFGTPNLMPYVTCQDLFKLPGLP